MGIAALFVLTAFCAGFGVLRILKFAKGAVAFGLAPIAGIGVLAVLSTWIVSLGAPPPVPGLVASAVVLVGFALAVADHHSIVLAASTLLREHRVAAMTLGAAVAVPMIAMGVAFAGAQVPLSPHDGASHTEAIQAYRLGLAWVDWYPPGLAALFAAWLQLFPWVDTAEGALDLGMSLPVLAAFGVFGLGVAVWRSLQMAAAGALLLSFTFVYPYFPEIWSGWPQALSLLFVIGTWTASLAYLERPSVGWGVLTGLMLGGVILVHGSELYTLALVLPMVLIAALRRIRWRALSRDLGIAFLVMLVCSAPYLPVLFHWAGNGGAGYGVGLEDGQAPAASTGPGAVSDPFIMFALGALGIDLPLRCVLLAIGGIAAFRMRAGRSVVAIGVVFVGITSCFTLLSGLPILRQAYAVTYPWGMHFRIFMVVAITQALLSGAGGVVLMRWLDCVPRRPVAWARRLGRVTRVLVLTWLALMTWSMTLFLAYPAQLVLGYSADDAAAMEWLRQHASPGTVLVNDGYADAGIWAPYKSGVELLLTRSASPTDLARAGIVIVNIGRLDQAPQAAAIACATHAVYVYRGARVSDWDGRRFPPLAELRASPVLEEVFSSGEAVVFRTSLDCDATH
jgi:hypothetical protein